MFKKVYIEITNICNKNCSFCSKDTKPKREMTTEEFEHIIDEIKPYTNYIYLHIKGEPLIHSKLEQILDICTKNKIWVNITTNGSLLKQKEDILLKENTIRQINISLHSFKKEEYIDNIVNTIEKLKTKDNINIVYRFWAIKNNHFSKDNLEILKQLQKYYSFDIAQIEQNNNLKLEKNIYLNKNDIFTWPNTKTKKIGTTGYCHALKTHFGILADGTVVPCCLDSSGLINLGNIFLESLSTILEKPKTKKIIRGFQNRKTVEDLCTYCSFKERF